MGEILFDRHLRNANQHRCRPPFDSPRQHSPAGSQRMSRSRVPMRSTHRGLREYLCFAYCRLVTAKAIWGGCAEHFRPVWASLSKMRCLTWSDSFCSCCSGLFCYAGSTSKRNIRASTESRTSWAKRQTRPRGVAEPSTCPDKPSCRISYRRSQHCTRHTEAFSARLKYSL